MRIHHPILWLPFILVVGCERPAPPAARAEIIEAPAAVMPQKLDPAQEGSMPEPASDPTPEPASDPLCDALKPDGSLREEIRGELGGNVELEFLAKRGESLRAFFEKSTFELRAGESALALSPHMDDVKMTAVSEAKPPREMLAEDAVVTVVVTYQGACDVAELCATPTVDWNCELPVHLVHVEPPAPPKVRSAKDVMAQMKSDGLAVARTDELGAVTLNWWSPPDEHDVLDSAAQVGGTTCSYTTGQTAFVARCPSGLAAIGKKWVVFDTCSPQFVARESVGAYLKVEHQPEWTADARRFPYEWNGEICRVKGFVSDDLLEVRSACCGDHHMVELDVASRSRKTTWVRRPGDR